MESKLHYIESFSYLSIWTSMCFYSLHLFHEAQSDILTENPYYLYSISDLKPGWSFLSRLKDVSDLEWNTMFFLIQYSWIYMFTQFVCSEVIRRKCNSSVLKYWYILSSTVFVLFYMGYKHLILMYIQPVIYLIVLCLGGKKISIWIASILILMGYNSLKNISYFWVVLEGDNMLDEQVIIVLFGMSWVELRCISYSIDYINELENTKLTKGYLCNNTPNISDIVNMFSYVLYLPVLYAGPLILYEEFENSFKIKNGKLLPKLRRFFMDTILYAIYALSLELALHYMYFYAMQSNMETIRKLPPLALVGGGIWMGFEFHTKYVISYGTMASFARLDNIDAPPTPRCIARIHLYSHMWRYFDVGLYRFLVKYIYKPIQTTMITYMNLRLGLIKILSSLTTYMFIFIWHGTMWSIFKWAALNYIGILVEVFGKSVSKTEMYKKFKENILKTDAMETRFIAFLGAPVLGYSIISNFYLFGGNEVGDLYFALLKWPSLYHFVLVYFSLYCSFHVGLAFKDLPSRTDVSIAEKNE